jgi:hypothetical protein
VQVAVVGEEAFFMSDVEHGSVIDFRILRQPTAELFGIPGVEVRVEVEDCDLAPS